MRKEQWRKIEEIFERAITLPPSERRRAVEQACGADEELLRDVWQLVKADADEENFLDEGVFTFGLKVLRDEDTLAEGTEIGFYRIRKLLGRGGMGAVYLARDTRLERDVALKILPPALGENEEGVERFRQEARVASAISHPNVAHIYEFGAEDGRYFLAMEYVEGKTLRAILREEKVDLSRALEIILQMTGALAATHARGIVHRDIKPENVIVTNGGLVKVLDFGVAKLSALQTPENKTEQSKISLVHTTPGTLMGTISYISPEQLRNKKADFRADIWSLGVVLYEMLAGRKPFHGKTAEEIGKAILTRPPLPLNLPEISRETEAAFKNIISKTLHKKAARRYASADELAEDLKKLKQSLETSGNKSFGEVSDRQPPSGGWELSGQTRSSAIFTVTRRFWNNQSTARKVLLLSSLLVILTFGVGFSARYLRPKPKEINENPQTASKITMLTEDGRVSDVTISSDANLIAYTLAEDGMQSLWIRDMQKGTENRILPPAFARYWGMRFTRDGQGILFIVTEKKSQTNILYRISPEGGTPDKIIADIAQPPAVSPDNRKIAFIRINSKQQKYSLMTANIDGSEETEIAARQFPEAFSLASCSWSPDGRLIALGASRGKGTESALVTVSVDKGELIELTPWKWESVQGVSWEGDGRGIVFSAEELGARQPNVWRLSYPYGQIRHLTDDEKGYQEVTAAQTENTLVTLRNFEVSEVWLLDSSGAIKKISSGKNEGADGLAVTPEGRVIFTVGEYQKSSLWSMNLDGGDRKQLTQNIGFLPSVSLDGRYITYVSMENGTHHIWLMDADGSHNRKLTNHLGENYPNLTPDGNWVIYTRLGKESSTLWKISTADGSEVQLTNGGFAIKPQISPDGTMIACTFREKASDEWKIIVMPVSGGAPVKTFDLPNPRYQMLRWAADSQSLIYVDKDKAVWNLWRQPLNGDAAVRMTNFTEDQIHHHAGFYAADQTVLSRGGMRKDIALIKNYK